MDANSDRFSIRIPYTPDCCGVEGGKKCLTESGETYIFRAQCIGCGIKCLIGERQDKHPCQEECVPSSKVVGQVLLGAVLLPTCLFEH